MFGMPSTKREGQTMLNMCMEQCEGVYLMDEIERLRQVLQQIADEGSGHGQALAYAALKEKE
jgi:hypothetical protein